MPQPSMLQFYVYFYIFVEASSASSQLRSTNDFARVPQSCLGWEMKNQVLHWIKEAWWKDHLELEDQLRRQLFHFF